MRSSATLPDLLGAPVRTIAGLSNLDHRRTGSQDPLSLPQKAFLPMLAAAGLDTILMNVLDPGHHACCPIQPEDRFRASLYLVK